jgi:hypothetical protein
MIASTLDVGHNNDVSTYSSKTKHNICDEFINLIILIKFCFNNN